MSPHTAAILRDYPRIYFGAHRRHTRDPISGDLVSQKQIQILDHLDEVNSTSLTDLAAHLGVTPGTMSVAVDRLIKRGYITRTPDTADRRRVHLRLTAAGARVCQAHSVLDPDLVQAMVDTLTDAERDLALRGLALLADAASRARSARQPRTDHQSLDHSA